MRMTRLSSGDLDRFHALCVDAHVRRFLLDGAEVPRDWAVAEIAKSEAAFAAGDSGLWLVHVAGQAEAVGFAGFRTFEGLGPSPQLLYAFVPEVGGQGLATRVCGWLLERAREAGRVQVEAAVDAPNRASVRVLEKNGFLCRGAVPGEFGECRLFTWFADPPVPRSGRHELIIATTWDGEPVDAPVVVTVDFGPEECRLTIDAPFHGDPPPAAASGRCPKLWEYEVVEVMWLGADDRYLEVEVAPRGQYLALMLHGRRQLLDDSLLLFVDAEIEDGRWRGSVRVPNAFLPPDCDRLNAFAIHGQGADRRFLAWSPRVDAPPDAGPDFHHLESFRPLPP